MLRGGLSLAMSLYTQVLCLCLPVSYSREEWVTLHGGRLVSSTQEAHRSHFPKHTERLPAPMVAMRGRIRTTLYFIKDKLKTDKIP